MERRLQSERICLVTEIFHPEDQGGQGRQAFALARRMSAHGALVSVATRRNFAASRASEVIDGIRISRLAPTGLLKGKGWRAIPPTLLFLTLLLLHLVRQRRTYDVILVQGVKAILIPTALAAWLLRKRCIVKVDAVAELEQELTPESLARMNLREGGTLVRYWARLRDALLRRAHATVAISAEIEAALTRRVGSATRVVRIPNGLELRDNSVPRSERTNLRRRLGLPEGLLVTFTGRLSRAKGLPMLLQVWSQIARAHQDAHLVLVGSGDRSFDGCEQELRDYVRGAQLDSRVTFTGHVENVGDYLQASDLFVSPSDSEGFGLSLVEAMAAGLPCVSTAVGVAPEVIRGRREGWLIPARDAAALSKALHDALEHRSFLPAIGAAARRAVASRFDMDQVARRYLEVCREVVGTSAPGIVAATGKLRRNASWLLACRVGADLLNFVLFLIVSRRFGPPGMGVYAYGFAIAGFVYSATTLGIDEYGIREYTRRPADRRPALLADLLGSQTCIAVIALIALTVYLIATSPGSEALTIILALTAYQLCAAFVNTLFVPSMAEQRMVWPSLVIVLGRALGLAIAVPLILIWCAALHIAVLAFALAGVVTVWLAARSAVQHGLPLRLNLALPALRANIRTLWSFAAADVMSQLFTRIGVIALTLLATERAAGVYAAGLKLVELACLPLLFLGRAAYPGLSRAFGNPPEFGRMTRQALWVGFAIAVLSAAAMAVAVAPLLVPMLGAGFAGSEQIVAAMAALAFVQGVEILLGRLLLSANMNVARAAWTTVGACVCAALTLATTRTFGIYAAIAAVVVSFILVDFLYAASLRAALRRRSFAAAETSVGAQPEAQRP
jgi:glycosyltransferase involved in cell wall biosynthesis/O-antigen/teichoic acid export membrane protein